MAKKRLPMRHIREVLRFKFERGLSHREIARSIGCQVSTWEPDEAQGWKFDTAQLESLLQTTWSPGLRMACINRKMPSSGTTTSVSSGVIPL